MRIASMVNVTSPFRPLGSSETDGILGLSRDGLPTILEALVAQDPSCKLHFSLCADAVTGNGLLSLCVFGNHHVGTANWAPMVQPDDGGYTIAIEGLAIGAKKFALLAPYVLVDSGTSAITIDDLDVYNGLLAELRAAAPMNFSTSGDCFPLSYEVALKFPNDPDSHFCIHHYPDACGIL